MNPQSAFAIRWLEQGLVPDRLVRLGMRRLLAQRLKEVRSGDATAAAELTQAFAQSLHAAPLALHADLANAQHYELPAAFFERVLGPRLKYSCCLWEHHEDSSLAQAEMAALVSTCVRAQLSDGQEVLELGCGWGALSLWMAEHYPASRITALSNSASQRAFIEARARARKLENLRVVTRDFSDCDLPFRHYDRVVSLEMFEHLRNWPRAFARVASWLRPGGLFFLHVFAHRETPYSFEVRDASDWMSQHFFTGGMMPSDDLPLYFQDHLRLVQRWRWDGRHYARTARAWLRNMDAHRDALLPVVQAGHGGAGELWWMRWRLFFMAVEELFDWNEGQQWWVGHYLFEPRA
ncbi:MAG: class I SAM-dependent methyltransferase [Proteobacteria bacterium]|nr:class I SAM-dependent methyltransferase [Pseudomonadota bacterium]